ncbi:MAG: NAD(P)H-dependent oxidoreductase [Lachnospiraceae bacterium]|nr:NAD(P)H-dependent oxidoreductase [Lachnospiraceae bacterium]
MESLRCRVIFAIDLGEDGINLEFERLLRVLRTQKGLLESCIGGVLIDAVSPLYTKAEASRLVQAANDAGCAFPGKCLVEGAGDLSNFAVEAANRGVSREEAYCQCAAEMVQSVLERCFQKKTNANLLVLHASSHRTSNTFALWEKVRAKLPGEKFSIREIGLRNGFLQDCSGCPYKMCLHFGEKDSCFYGGVMVEDVYPAIREADAVLMVCPNYNDALSANLVACINRLTALYRAASFRDKALYSIIVSGYSGNDIIARQLIGALNMNKGFYLPPRFALMETANAPGEALRIPGIDAQTAEFAERIRSFLTR